MYNFHPGSHLGKIEVEEALRRVSDSINLALERTQSVIAVIENTAGQGNPCSVRSNLERKECWMHVSRIERYHRRGERQNQSWSLFGHLSSICSRFMEFIVLYLLAQVMTSEPKPS